MRLWSSSVPERYRSIEYAPCFEAAFRGIAVIMVSSIVWVVSLSERAEPMMLRW